MEFASDLAVIARAIGDPVRAAMLDALIDGRALPAGELAMLGNVSPQTASFHLNSLLNASLLKVERQGRHSYYRLANDAVASALEALAALAPPAPEPRSRYESDSVKQLRFARSCYKHLAGSLATEINRALLAREFLLPQPERAYSLSQEGRQWFQSLGILHPAPGRACLDWTERRHHLGGPLGVALFAQLKERRWLVANPNTRAVRLTHQGMSFLHRQLGIQMPAR